MSCLKVICWALIFIFKLRFPPGVSIAIVCIEQAEAVNLKGTIKTGDQNKLNSWGRLFKSRLA